MPPAPRPRKKSWWRFSSAARPMALNIVVPHGERAYYDLRPTIAVPRPAAGSPDAAIDLDGFFGLHPSLAPLKPLYDRAASGDRGCRRFARPHALPLRRAGLHGIGHARLQSYRERLDEPRAAEAAGSKVRRCGRWRWDRCCLAHDGRRRTGRHRCKHRRLPGARRGCRTPVRTDVRRSGRPGAASHRP
jgi:hypothetical protein